MSIFSLFNYKDLLLKCKLEASTLKDCSSHPEYDYILFNIVMGINHLFEWYLKDQSVGEKNKIACLCNFNPFNELDVVSADFKSLYKKLEPFPNKNYHQEAIRQLCNKAKHFKQKMIERQDKNYTCLFGNESFGNTSFGSFNHYLYFVELNGHDTDLSDLLVDLLKQWESFLEENV
ncbi:hypothetical protein N5C36_03165 [Shewanella xiamenensis]|uniref:hypothetical protein n=1 Tax=Shewanella xiamenensis TaxID=332186 RepID=UPI001C4E2803|nr:hypothetical protein [Shewanella xiamenensis]MBW0295114.1 hypothetical protein [Shewanella xiamenensis]MDH1313093.1 hypothetical protein [Shewanella xiamenensis]